MWGAKTERAFVRGCLHQNTVLKMYNKKNHIFEYVHVKHDSYIQTLLIYTRMIHVTLKKIINHKVNKVN